MTDSHDVYAAVQELLICSLDCRDLDMLPAEEAWVRRCRSLASLLRTEWMEMHEPLYPEASQ